MKANNWFRRLDSQHTEVQVKVTRLICYDVIIRRLRYMAGALCVMSDGELPYSWTSRRGGSWNSAEG